MKGSTAEPQIVSESDVKMVGPGYDDDHYISVPIKPFFEFDGVGDIGVCQMAPGDQILAGYIRPEIRSNYLFFFAERWPSGRRRRS